MIKTFAILSLLAAAPAAAAPSHEVCVPDASGVPTREGPPKWLNWSGSGTTAVDQLLDDPRWLGATGQAFEVGSATPPLQTRSVVSTVGGKDYLFTSFIVDLEPSATTPRDLFLGFRRVTSLATSAGTEFGYIFQFHLTGTAASHSTVAPIHCARFSDCAEGTGTARDFWRVFVDYNKTFTHTDPGDCPNGHLFERFTGATVNDPPITWMTKPTATACTADPTCTALDPNSYCNIDGFCTSSDDAVRYWKLDATQAPLLANRWAVQVRIPIVASGQPLSAGIERNATMWYEITEKTFADNYANVAFWPDDLTTSICTSPTASLSDFLVHPELGSVDTSCPGASCVCPGCNPDYYSGLAELTPGATVPGTCDGGITIDHGDVGSLFNAPAGSALAYFSSHQPNDEILAGGVNTLVAQPVNTTSTDITAKIQGRFRLAGWGSAPWSVPSDTGTWKDLRPASNGVCTGGTAPPCGSMTIPAHGKGAIWVNWTIGDDTGPGGLKDSEYCKYGLKPPGAGAMCNPGCDCTAAGAQCDVKSGTGVQASTGGPCVTPLYQFDQCMLVELTGQLTTATTPPKAVQFVKQSTWNNMTFGSMSVLSREALIDARELPRAPGQQYQDLYLLVMPRNLPASVPATSTGVSLTQARAVDAAARIAQPYLDDINRIPPVQIRAIIDRLQRTPLEQGGGSGSGSNGDNGDKRIPQIRRAMQVMPPADFQRVARLLDIALGQNKQGGNAASALVHDAVSTLGPTAAAGVVSTLEIYPYYQPLGQGRAYQPMTAFSVFLSHENTLSGTRYVIDGADKVADNVYHMRIPVGFAKRILIRAEAVEGKDVLTPPNPAWPCAGGCAACGGVNRSCGLVAALGSGGPGLLAFVWLIGRRRKQPQRRG
jgi:hypothetical protein